MKSKDKLISDIVNAAREQEVEAIRAWSNWYASKGSSERNQLLRIINKAFNDKPHYRYNWKTQQAERVK